MVDRFNMGVLVIDQIKLHLHQQQNDMSNFLSMISCDLKIHKKKCGHF